MTIHDFRIPANSVNGMPGREILIRPNQSGPEPIFISAPLFCLLDEGAAIALANSLVDIVEARRGEAA